MKKNVPVHIYLASQSARRRGYLQRMRHSFEVVPSRYRETSGQDNCPEKVVMRHARQKALQAVLPGNRNLPGKRRFVLGADTIVYFRKKILGKPANLTEAEKMLKGMRGKSHHVYSGLALRDLDKGILRLSYEVTKVRFKKLSAAQIREYLRRIHPLDKAGSYAIQKRPFIVASYEGSYSNVVGLPVELFRAMLLDALSS